MVQEFDADDEPRALDAESQGHVIIARRRVPGRMIVEHDNRRRPGEHRLAEHVTRLRQALVDRSYRNHSRRHEPVPRVEQDHANLLHHLCTESRKQERGHIPCAQKLQAPRRGTRQRAPAQFDGGLDTARLGRADARVPGHRTVVELRQSLDAPRVGQQRVGHGERAVAGAPVADEHCQQFVIAERPHAVPLELLAGTIVGQHIMHQPFSLLQRGARVEALRYTRGRMMRPLLLPIAGVALLLAACSTPPDKERHQAEGAITAAREAGAAEYASSDLASAQSALDKYDAAVAQRDYRLALSLAVEARDTAYHAAKRAADNKAAARGEAERLVADVTRLLSVARARIPASPARSQLMVRLRAAVADAEEALQESRAAIDRQAYQAAIDRLQPVDEALHAELGATAGPSPRRVK